MPVSKYTFEVEDSYQGYRLQEYLEHKMFLVSTTIRRLVYARKITVNEQPAGPGLVLVPGDVINVALEANERHYRLPEILYENQHFLIVNKPAGIAVVPPRGSRQAIFRQMLKTYLATRSPFEASEETAPRIVHRIDQQTSGAVLVAKNTKTERLLGRLFSERRIQKEYLAVVLGRPPAAGTIDLPVAPQNYYATKMKVDPDNGRPAISHYEAKEFFRLYTLLQVKIETGRTHQIRVHLASQGYPLAVDPLYGGKQAIFLSQLKPNYRPKKGQLEKPLISRLTLHSQRMSFQCPFSGETITATAPLPPDLQLLLKMLRKYARLSPERYP